ncbi:hypothetical protein [Micromonospora sp. CB01531]|uniref:hypothetical protein n=1 Tax=Micromonospora sp. CB01531 TaxID=1718947 RepID=UPI00093D031E|nr:hypothetical protein [Micromonospora sp. CB01531]OKI64018.1 hypothetical protein A6A27_26225 [Micromonospora sp. CB01531]
MRECGPGGGPADPTAFDQGRQPPIFNTARRQVVLEIARHGTRRDRRSQHRTRICKLDPFRAEKLTNNYYDTGRRR